MLTELPDLLERARRELLDLSTRDRLLPAPVNSKSARVITVHDELAIRRPRHIGDITNWKNHEAYQKAFERLLRDLKAASKA